MKANNDTKVATVLHLSTLSQYIIPFGNYIFPIIIWSSKKDKSKFIDFSGKQVLNFQLSLFLYSIILSSLFVPIFIFTFFQNIPFDICFNDCDFNYSSTVISQNSGWVVLGITAALLLCILKIIEFVVIILAAVKTLNGEHYKYPISLPFFK